MGLSLSLDTFYDLKIILLHFANLGVASVPLLLVWDLYKHVNLVGRIKNHKRCSKLQCCL